MAISSIGNAQLLNNRRFPRRDFVHPRNDTDNGRTHLGAAKVIYLPGLKESFRLTDLLNTRCSALLSLESGQK